MVHSETVCTKARRPELNFWGEMKSLRHILMSNFPFSVAQSCWIQLWWGISTTPQTVTTVSLSQLSCFSFNLSLTRSPTGHTCVTLQTQAISTSPQDDVAWLNCNKVVNWQRPRHAAAGGGWAFCVLPGAVTDIPPDNFPPQLPEFLTFVFIRACQECDVQSYFMWHFSVTLLSK